MERKKEKRKHSRNRQYQNSHNSALSPKISLRSYKKQFSNALNNFLNTKQRMLTRGALQRLNKQNTSFLSKDSSSQNNIIIINDSDNEISNKNKMDTSFSIVKCSPNTGTISLQQQSPGLRKRKRSSLTQNNNRLSVISLENDISFIHSSGTQESSINARSVDGENIAPSQTEDDVIEVWSCLGNSSKANNVLEQHKHCWTDKNFGFVIDTMPDYRNLEYLNSDMGPARKKRKVQRYFNEDILVNKSVTEVTPEPGDDSKEIKRRDDDANSNLVRSNIQSSKCRKNEKEMTKNKKSNDNPQHKLREIIIDGCNIAMLHANGKTFSEKGIMLVVDYFKSRDHDVKVFLPQHYRKNRYQLETLYKEGTVVFTPSRYINGRRITPYEDRYILEYATECKGIVISSDQYRDLYEEKPEWRDTILNRLLSPTFVGDYVMFPEDPLGKFGPDLQTFLRH